MNYTYITMENLFIRNGWNMGMVSYFKTIKYGISRCKLSCVIA